MSGTTKGHISVSKIGVIGCGANTTTPLFRLGPADPRMGVVGLKPLAVTQQCQESSHA